jgi:anti-sigma factor RsiW
LSCGELKEALQEYVDGGLPPAEAAEVERHLAACDACRAEIVFLQAIDAALSESPVERAPAGLSRNVLDMIAIRARRRAAIERLAVLVGVAVGLVSSGVAIWTSAPPGGETRAAMSEGLTTFFAPAFEQIGSAASSLDVGVTAPLGMGAQGVIWALAAAALSVMAVAVLRLSRERILGWD